MASQITFEVPDDVRAALDEATRAEGVSPGELMERALRKYLFVSRFRELRAETQAFLRNSGQADLTDEDVFRLVS